MIQPTPNPESAYGGFRFSVVGSLELSPTARTLQSAIRSLAAMTWSHPVTGREADTNAKKRALVREGPVQRVRVLIGSTQKMGTGTNVQKRLIALHHWTRHGNPLKSSSARDASSAREMTIRR